jgi:hypothetical protein
MSKKPETVDNQALKVFRAKKTASVDEIAAILGASLPTARRRLKAWGAYRSYNHNGRFYALPAVVRFDDNGLWQYRGIGFSEHGNLGQTLVQLVTRSEGGLCAAELGVLLGMAPHAFLSQFRAHPALSRQKHQGRFVYFSAQAQRHLRQVEARERKREGAELPGDSEAVAILVSAIKHPGLSARQLCRKVEKDGGASTPQRIENLFARHGLTLKKTPPSVS